MIIIISSFQVNSAIMRIIFVFLIHTQFEILKISHKYEQREKRNNDEKEKKSIPTHFLLKPYFS